VVAILTLPLLAAAVGTGIPGVFALMAIGLVVGAVVGWRLAQKTDIPARAQLALPAILIVVQILLAVLLLAFR